MDIATLIGLIVGWGAVISMVFLEGGDILQLWNLPAFVLVVFGTLGAGLIGTSLRVLGMIPGMMKSAFQESPVDHFEIIEQIVGFAKVARREGILSLEKTANNVENPFLRKGLALVVDGTPSESVREIMETEIAMMQERHKSGHTLFSSLGGLSPTLGIIGTVMGLINMLAKLNEPGDMGHAIAAAFIATLYGVSLANLLYIPIASKLKRKTEDEVMAYEMIIEGLLALQAGASPRIVELRLMSYLPPALRMESADLGGSEGRKAA